MTGNDDVPLSLGEVARRVQAALQVRESPTSRQNTLLHLLRNKEICSFVILCGTPELRIAVPARYWHRVTTREFNSIRFVAKSSRYTASFTLALSDISEAAVDALLSETTDENIRSILSEALTSADREREVYVLQSELNNWLASRNIDIDSQYTAATRKERGRRRLSGWDAIWKSLAQELMVEMLTANVQPTGDSKLAAAARAAAEKDHVAKDSLPGIATVQKAVATLMTDAQEQVRRTKAKLK